MILPITIREITDSDRAYLKNALINVWGSVRVFTLGRFVDASQQAGFIARDDNEQLGFLTYEIKNGEMEIVSIAVHRKGRGIGRALIMETS